MGLAITDWFGFSPEDRSEVALRARQTHICPISAKKCGKRVGGRPSGVCALKPSTSEEVVCCPIRLYADDYKILQDIAEKAFGSGKKLSRKKSDPCPRIATFGRNWGQELRLPARSGRGAYSVDWVLAHIDGSGTLIEFVPVEVQTMDTTGNYRAQLESLQRGGPGTGTTGAMNWENVSKRIITQLITKGRILARERLCHKGLFFVSPEPVIQRIFERLGGKPAEHPLQTGAITFLGYELTPYSESAAGHHRTLQLASTYTTSIDSVAYAFVAPSNLPQSNVYEKVILQALR